MDVTNKVGIMLTQNRSFSYKNIAPDKPVFKEQLSKKQLNDTISISKEAKALIEEDLDELNEEKKLLDSENKLEDLKELTKTGNQKNDMLSDDLKCVQIAMRIMNGDNVPSKDVKFLAVKNPKLLSNAILLRRQNDKPKDYKSLLDDEKDDTKTNPLTPNSPDESLESIAQESIEFNRTEELQ